METVNISAGCFWSKDGVSLPIDSELYLEGKTKSGKEVKIVVHVDAVCANLYSRRYEWLTIVRQKFQSLNKRLIEHVTKPSTLNSHEFSAFNAHWTGLSPDGSKQRKLYLDSAFFFPFAAKACKGSPDAYQELMSFATKVGFSSKIDNEFKILTDYISNTVAHSNTLTIDLDDIFQNYSEVFVPQEHISYPIVKKTASGFTTIVVPTPAKDLLHTAYLNWKKSDCLLNQLP